MKKIVQILLITLSLGITAVEGQTNHHYKLFDFSVDSNLRRIDLSALTADGGMIVLTGNEYRGSLSATDYGFSIIRYDVNGNKLWNNFVSGFTSANAVFLRMVELSDNGFAIAGNSAFNGSGFILKTDASGNVVFMKSYSLQIYDCVVDPSDNGFIITTNAGNTYSGIIKTNSSGDVVWSDARNYTVDPDHYYQARRLNNGNYLAVGTAYDNPSISNGTALIACYSPAGTLLWSQRYAGPEWTAGFKEFTELPDGSILLAGTSSQITLPGLRTLITKVDSAGNVLWCKSSLPTSNISDFGYEFADGFLYMAGNYAWSGVDIRAATTKINSNGDVLWTRIHPEYDYINDVIYGSSNDFSIMGNKMAFNNTRTFCSTDTALSQSCALYDTAYVFVNVNMTAQPATHVVITPVTSATSQTRINFSAVNFIKRDVCSTSGIESGISNGDFSVSVYPNPAKENLTIQIASVQFATGLNFRLVNNLGKTVKEVLLTNPKTILELDGLLPGIYFYSIKNQKNVIKSGKLLVE